MRQYCCETGTCLIEFEGNLPGKEGRWVGKEVRDPVIENKILKGLNRRVRDRLIAPTRRRTYWLKKEAKEGTG